MIKTFMYVNVKGEIKQRNVLVLNENDSYIQGYDLELLDNAAASLCKETFKNHTVGTTIKFGRSKKSDIATTRQPQPYDSAFRLFKTENIIK